MEEFKEITEEEFFSEFNRLGERKSNRKKTELSDIWEDVYNLVIEITTNNVVFDKKSVIVFSKMADFIANDTVERIELDFKSDSWLKVYISAIKGTLNKSFKDHVTNLKPYILQVLNQASEYADCYSTLHK